MLDRAGAAAARPVAAGSAGRPRGRAAACRAACRSTPRAAARRENSVLPIEIAAPSTNVTIRCVYLPTSRWRICLHELVAALLDLDRLQVVRVQPDLQPVDVAVGRGLSGRAVRMREVVVEPDGRRLRLPDDGGGDRQDDEDERRQEAQVHERDREAAREPQPLERRARAGRAAARSAPRRGRGRRRERPPSRAPTPARAAAASPTSWTQRGIWIRGGRPAAAHGADATARVRRLSPPDWDWSFEVDGALALDRHELWDEPQPNDAARAVSQAAATVESPGGVRYGAPDAGPGPRPARRARARRRELELERRRRRIAVLIALTAIARRRSCCSRRSAAPARSRSSRRRAPRRLLPAGPPTARDHRAPRHAAPAAAGQPVARDRDRLPGRHRRLARRSRRSAPRRTRGSCKRVLHAVVGSSRGEAALVPAARRPGAGDLGARRRRADRAPTSTRPVDGTVVAISQVVLNGQHVRLAASTSSRPPRRRSSSRSRTCSADPALVVGSPLTAGGSKLGSVVDFSRVEHQALARYTNDAGNHVVVEVHASPALGLG